MSSAKAASSGPAKQSSSSAASTSQAQQGTSSPKPSQKKPQIMDILDNQLEQLADELTRRKANSATSTPTTAKRPLPPPGGGGHHHQLNNNHKTVPSSHPFSNMYHPRTFDYNGSTTDEPRKTSNSSSSGGSSSGNSSGQNSRKTSNESAATANDDWQDPGQLLNAWLGELDSIRKGLDEVSTVAPSHRPHRPLSPPAVEHLRNPHRGATSISSNTSGGVGGVGRCQSPSLSTASSSYTATSSRESSATPVHMRRMSTPRVESPRLDSYRYSLINLEDSLDNDLDAILGELCALESNFNNTAQQLQQQQQQQQKKPQKKVSNGSSSSDSRHQVPPALPASPASHDCLKNGQIPNQPIAEPQYITAEIVRQNKAGKVPGGQQNSTGNNLSPQSSTASGSSTKRTESPDNDSAFCDNASTSNSGNSNETNDKAVLDRLDGHLQLPVKEESGNNADSESITSTTSSSKAEKIRIAIEKIKEASIKKIFIKVFGEDGSAKSLLVDERMSVSQVCRMLADKNHVKRDTNWALVELLPDLHMERAYEDHEQLVENLLMWKADSKNTLWFIKRPEVHDIFSRPEMYLLGETSSQIGLEMDERARAELVEEYFSSSGVGAPEVEGFLWLKAESKKSWKKFRFVLRTSGLYYAPKAASATASAASKLASKPSHSTKDLVCLARFDVNQVYYGVKWQAKFKSPTRHCFAIKHPQIQAKNPKYIRYLAADSEQELNKWVTGIRVAKYGKTIYENYRSIIEEIAHDDIDKLASARLSSVSNHETDGVKGASPSASNHHPPTSQSLPHPQLTAQASSCSSVRTPTDENKSFDSAFQLSQDSSSQQLQATASSSMSSSATAAVKNSSHFHHLPHHHQLQQEESMKSNGSNSQHQQHQQPQPLPEGVRHHPHSIMKHHLTDRLTGAKRSSSSGSLSDRSGRSSVEPYGFNCDSPEGGTIKKKPGEAKAGHGIVKQAMMAGAGASGTASSSGLSNAPSKPHKGVRFLDSYSTIPASDDDDGISTISSSSANPASNSQSAAAASGQEAEVYNNIDRILATNKSVLAKTGAATGHQMATPPSNMQRRYSNESLVSNPAMLHTGAIVHAEDIASSVNPTDSFIKPSQVAAYSIGNHPVKSPSPPNTGAVGANGKPSAPTPGADFPAQPNRPAPVLKPSVARKPSIDKSVLVRKNSGGGGSGSSPSKPQPTYEDTLKKCQSLTSGNSNRQQPSNVTTPPSGDNDKQQQQPKSSPALPPKPSLAALRGQQQPRVAHLPPSGLHPSVRSNSANGRLASNSPLKSQQHQLNQAFLNDLHTAMASKLNGGGTVNGHAAPVARPEDDLDSGGPPAFPNRFSSGEYDNIKKGDQQKLRLH